MIKLMIIGNLTRDPEKRSVNGQNGLRTVTDFTVASNDRNNNSTFIRISVWDRLAETCAQYLHKGSKVYAECSGITARSYATQSGEQRVSLEATAQQVEFLSSRGNSESDDTPFVQSPVAAPVPTGNAAVDRAMENAHKAYQQQPMQMVVDEELPF